MVKQRNLLILALVVLFASASAAPIFNDASVKNSDVAADVTSTTEPTDSPVWSFIHQV